MGSLTELIDDVYNLLGSETTYTVYGKPPENVSLSYPCIIISLDSSHTRRADDRTYMKLKKYTFTVITKDVFDTTYDLLEDHFPYCRFENNYITDELYHYKLSIYY